MNSDIDAETPKKAAASLSDNRGYASEKRHSNSRIENPRAGRFLDQRPNRENVRFSGPIGDDGVISGNSRDTPHEYQGRGRHDSYRRSGNSGSGGISGSDRYTGSGGEGCEAPHYAGRKNRDDYHRGAGSYRSGNVMSGNQPYTEPQTQMSHVGMQQPSLRGTPRYGKSGGSNRQHYNKGTGMQRRPPLQHGSMGGGGHQTQEQYHDFHRGGAVGEQQTNYSNHKQYPQQQQDPRYRPHGGRVGNQPPPPPPAEYAPPATEMTAYAHRPGVAIDNNEMQQNSSGPLIINASHVPPHIYHDYPIQNQADAAFQNKTVNRPVPAIPSNATPATYAAIPIATTGLHTPVYMNPVNVANSGNNKLYNQQTTQFNRSNVAAQQQYGNNIYGGGRVSGGYAISNNNSLVQMPAPACGRAIHDINRIPCYHPAADMHITLHSENNMGVLYSTYPDENHDNLQHVPLTNFTAPYPIQSPVVLQPNSPIDLSAAPPQENIGPSQDAPPNYLPANIHPNVVADVSSAPAAAAAHQNQQSAGKPVSPPISKDESAAKDDGWDDDGFGGGVSMVDVATLKNKVAYERQQIVESPKPESNEYKPCQDSSTKDSRIELEVETAPFAVGRGEEEVGMEEVVPPVHGEIADTLPENVISEKPQDLSDTTTDLTGPASNSADDSSVFVAGGEASTAVSVSLESQQPSSDFSNNGAQAEIVGAGLLVPAHPENVAADLAGQSGDAVEGNAGVAEYPGGSVAAADETKSSAPAVELAAEDARDETKESESASLKEVVTGSSSSQSPQVETPKTSSGGNLPWRLFRSGLSRTESIERQVKSLLNKITIEKFPSITEQIAVLQENTQDLQELQCVVDQVVGKAVREPEWSEMYADLCQILNMRSPEWGENSHQSFRVALLTKIQAEFQGLPKSLEVSEEMQANLDNAGIELQLKKMKNHILGVVKLIGELFQRKLLAYKIVAEVASNLVMNIGAQPHEHYVECFLALISTTGYYIEQVPAYKSVLDLWFGRLVELKTKEIYSKRLKCVLQDVLDMRKAGWKKKIHRDRAMTLSDVRGQVEKEDYLGGSTHFAQYGNIVTMGKPSNAQSSKPYADYFNQQRLRAESRRHKQKPHTNV